MHCDLASQASVATFAAEFISLNKPLHLLVRVRARWRLRTLRPQPGAGRVPSAGRMNLMIGAGRGGTHHPARLHPRPQINNAGILNPSDLFQLTEDHMELTLATNYFGPCLLTLLLQVRGRRCPPQRRAARWDHALHPEPAPVAATS